MVNIDGNRDHTIVQEGITVLCNLEHRGAVGSDKKTGDGAGMLIQIPDKFFRKVLDFDLPVEGQYGVGFIFLPNSVKDLQPICNMVEEVVITEGGKVLGWRDVPTNEECLGEIARQSCPKIKQIFVAVEELDSEKLNRKLYIIRKCIETAAGKMGLGMNDFYIPSFSASTIIYKGMFVSTQFSEFYPDLVDKDMKSAIALVHQRYSTNTFPSWAVGPTFSIYRP